MNELFKLRCEVMNFRGKLNKVRIENKLSDNDKIEIKSLSEKSEYLMNLLESHSKNKCSVENKVSVSLKKLQNRLNNIVLA